MVKSFDRLAYDDPTRVRAFDATKRKSAKTTKSYPFLGKEEVTKRQEDNLDRMRIPKGGTPEWDERSKESRLNILKAYDKTHHLCDDFNCPDKGKPVEEAHK